MFRYRKTLKQYKTAPKSTECPFCESAHKETAVKETKHALVIKNKFGYDLWEFRDVVEHLLIIPKRHAASLAELAKDELAEIMSIIAEYEQNKYNVYARALGSVQRTVPAHQHTHLIKTTDTKPKGVLFTQKPYLLVKM